MNTCIHHADTAQHTTVLLLCNLNRAYQSLLLQTLYNHIMLKLNNATAIQWIRNPQLCLLQGNEVRLTDGKDHLGNRCFLFIFFWGEGGGSGVGKSIIKQ